MSKNKDIVVVFKYINVKIIFKYSQWLHIVIYVVNSSMLLVEIVNKHVVKSYKFQYLTILKIKSQKSPYLQ